MSSPSHLITNRPYLPSLDGWRGVAAMMVVLFHFYYFFADQQYFNFGYLSVDFFFVLSGFIIARQYEAAIEEDRLTFVEFAVRRAARLWPAYIVSIGMFLAVNAILLKPTDNAVNFSSILLPWYLFLQLTMLGNIGGMIQPWNGPAWSVSVEWVVNLLYFFASSWGRLSNFFFVLVAAICFTYLLIISPTTLHLVLAEPPVFNPTIARGLLGFSLGNLVFRYHERLPNLPWYLLYPLEIVFAWGLVMLCGMQDKIPGIDYVFIFVFPFIIILSLYRHGLINNLMSLFPFVLLGRLSYSIYLLHLPVGYVYKYVYQKQLEALYGKPELGLIFLGAVLVASIINYALIEKPCRSLGRRFLLRNKAAFQ